MKRLRQSSGVWISLLQHLGAGAGFRFCTRYVDIIVVPWLLASDHLFAYLLARSISLFVPLSLAILAYKLLPNLTRLAQKEHQTPFRAAAARVNLSYMMVCGAVALILMSTAPYFVYRIAAIDAIFTELLTWFIVGQSAPVLFGATGLLMYAVERAAFYDVLQGITGALFLIGLYLLDPIASLPVAQTLVAAQLAQAAICAILLTQCGVWPGLTSLLHKEIKLF